MSEDVSGFDRRHEATMLGSFHNMKHKRHVR